MLPLYVVLAVLASLTMAVTNGTYPSNSTRTLNTTLLSPLTLTLQDGVSSVDFALQPAFSALDPSEPWWTTFSDPFNRSGSAFLMNTSNYNLWTQGHFGLVSCDPEEYPGDLDLQTMLSDAAGQYKPSSSSEPWALVFYTQRSEWCCMIGASPFDSLPYVFTTTSRDDADGMVDMLSATPTTYRATVANAIASNTSSAAAAATTTTGSSQPDGPSPTTTVAMIILYSITGLITLCFIFIIVTGAVRAHRHPERYRPRNFRGALGHGRARGIARAMLDSIPIVKFGESEPDKEPEANRGVELESGIRGDPADPPNAPEAPTSEVQAQEETSETAAEPRPEGIQPALETATAPNSSAQAEAGLACSVCTDDFVRGQDTRVLPCDHKFHPECIDPWLLNVSGTCPLCRVDLNPPEALAGPSGPSDLSTSSLAVTAHYAAEGPIYVATGLNNVYRRVDAVGRRSSAGVFAAFHRSTINRQRMRDASPAERMRMLRELRYASRNGEVRANTVEETNGEGGNSGNTNVVTTASNVGSNAVSSSPSENQRETGRRRFSRLLKRRSGQESQEPTVPMTAQNQDVAHIDSPDVNIPDGNEARSETVADATANPSGEAHHPAVPGAEESTASGAVTGQQHGTTMDEGTNTEVVTSTSHEPAVPTQDEGSSREVSAAEHGEGSEGGK